jgi:aryl carrier-like protein
MANLLTADIIRADVAEVLHRLPHETQDHEDMFEAGMDSLRLQILIERWRGAGAEISFVDLAERATLANWLSLLIVTPEVTVL